MNNKLDKNKPLFNYDIKKEVYSSIEAIKNLQTESAYKVVSKGNPLDGAVATSVKNGKKGFTIKFFTYYDPKVVNADYFKIFKLTNKILLEKSGQRFAINENSVKKIRGTLSEPKVISIDVINFQTQEDKYFDNKILRLVIPTPKEVSFEVFECKRLKIGDTITYAGVIEVKLETKTYQIFKYENDDTKKSFLIIDCAEKNGFEEFKKNTSSILIAFGFITGNLYLNEYYYQIINNSTKTQIEDTAYFKKEPSIISDVSILNPFRFEEYLKHLKKESLLKKVPLRLSQDKFSRICCLVTKNQTLARSIKMLLEGNQTKFLLLRAGIYSIALETITKIICDENKDRLNPIPDKKLSDIIISKFHKLLDEYDFAISEYGMNILKIKIENLNSPTNSKKLSKPFEIYNIKLNETELDILKHRNKFLHGTSPFKEDDLINKEKDVAYITKKLLTLCNILILKYCGYSGYITDYGGFHKMNWDDELSEHLFRII